MKARKVLAVLQPVTKGLLAFFVGVLVTVILLLGLFLVLMRLLNVPVDFSTLSNYRGYFSAWSIFASSPSATEKILRADANKTIWVETKTGEIYFKSFYPTNQKNIPWKKEKKTKFIYTQIYSEQFGSCKFDKVYDFEKSFGEPPEKVVQCVRFEEWYPDSISIWYFALSKNGKIWVYEYWQSEIFGILSLCFLAIIIPILFLTVFSFGITKLKLRLEGALQND